MSFRSLKGTHYLNLMRYHGTSIENTYCHQLSSAMTKSMGIYDHIRILSIGQSFLLTSANTQYPLKVKSLCNIVAW